MAWSFERALSAVERLELAPANSRLAVYWLSLWKDDTPPSRGDFSPSHVSDLLGGIALTELRDNHTPVCRLAGTVIEFGIGRRLTGANLLDFLPEEQKEVRIARSRAIVDGAVSVSRTSYVTRDGVADYVETVQLPFAGMNENGSRQFLAHINWRPAMGRSVIEKPGLGMGLPETFLCLPIA